MARERTLSVKRVVETALDSPASTTAQICDRVIGALAPYRQVTACSNVDAKGMASRGPARGKDHRH